ncbi:SRPBCC family protein [Georgenia sp. H159]|uniref:SRPBCC family protein n=1 Tax=Georgenia sp. H159 TaxID=3076115 RepID=UPI002D76D2AF|nr:SRPBCC family protein [Georgenia sp. H159]
MTTQVHKSIEVNVPVSTAYNQWTQFEEFPHFMGGVQSVTQLTDDRLEWVAEIAGVKRRWKARILEQVPDRKVAWAAIEGATNAGAVEFADLGGRTQVTLTLEYEPEGLVEKVGDALSVIERQAESDLANFKEFIEAEGYATGAWRGTVDGVGTPGLEDATSQGDSGKAGLGKAAAAAAGLGAAAAGAAIAAGVKKKSDSDVPGVTVTPAAGDADLATTDADFVGGDEADTAPSGTARTAGGAVGTGAGGGTGDELVDDALQPATDESDPAHPRRSTAGDDPDDLTR